MRTPRNDVTDPNEHTFDRTGPTDADDRSLGAEVRRRQEDGAEVATRPEVHVVNVFVDANGPDGATDDELRIAVLLVAEMWRDHAKALETPSGYEVFEALEMERRARALEARVGGVSDADARAVEYLWEVLG